MYEMTHLSNEILDFSQTSSNAELYYSFKCIFFSKLETFEGKLIIISYHYYVILIISKL